MSSTVYVAFESVGTCIWYDAAKTEKESNENPKRSVFFISLSPLVKDEGILAGIVARENSASAGLENELGNCHGKAGYT
ncbi:hypothetical protein N8U73_23705, partial [Enterobacter hormaechei subsp. hoffmannii]|nr:hypothetical protein [Enterobacter hormaechei subsp. hoffmannii]